MSGSFIDTNVFLRYLTEDDPTKAERCLALLQRIERGEERALTSPLVIFEVVFTLQRSYKLPKAEVRELVTPIIELRALHIPGKHLFYRAFDLYVEQNISFADAYNAVYMDAHDADEVYSYDAEFDRVTRINRVEP